jgi:hypothetical protein
VSIFQRFLQLVQEANVLYAKIHGTPQLSLKSGLIVEALVTQCGVSMEKLPMVIVLVLAMMLGKLGNEEEVAQVVKATDTYAVARERAADVSRGMNKQTFTAPATDPRRVLVAHLQCDDSNKGVDVTCLPITVLCGDNTVRSRSLLALQAVSKKSSASRRITQSIRQELTDRGAVRVLGGTTDGFRGAAHSHVPGQ